MERDKPPLTVHVEYCVGRNVPDLLNNLFGVVLRFRENAVAVCGDITKMYHMVAIPPVDKYVHRFPMEKIRNGT